MKKQENDPTNCKVYVFIQACLSGMGGAQLYVSAKSLWLARHSWDVIAVHGCGEKYDINYGRARIVYDSLVLSRPSTLKKSLTNRVIENIAAYIEKYDEIVIESGNLEASLWGELLAERLGAKHFIFSLMEVLPMMTQEERDFLAFKHARGEFAAIHAGTMWELFGESRCIDYEKNVLVARANPAAVELDFDIGFLDRHDCVIGMISRLEKTYVVDAFEAVVLFAKNNPETSIAFVVIGDADIAACKAKLQALVEEAANLETYFMGTMCPIPLSLIRRFDMAIGKAGGALLCAEHGVPTLCFAVEEDVIAGLVLHDFETIPGKVQSKVEPQSLMRAILVDQRHVDNRYRRIGVADELPDFIDHMKYIEASSASCSYCNPSHIAAPMVKKGIGVFASIKGSYPFALINFVKRHACNH
ncbi:hypothetical protein [Paraeggerthella sp. Marseille-Q4926]|uniref:hypothetical protein n=1 Tax=Paraeggerthella sp. Marseille-Q4926 TaxID=2866587 RepID=UPI001CE409D0|nr:hypothetical protein [Paraeggerthella sp. Marseille-Q4926]